MAKSQIKNILLVVARIYPAYNQEDPKTKVFRKFRLPGRAPTANTAGKTV